MRVLSLVGVWAFTAPLTLAWMVPFHEPAAGQELATRERMPAPVSTMAPAFAPPPTPRPDGDLFMNLASRRGNVLAAQFPLHAPRQQMTTELRLFSNALLCLAVARAIRDNPGALPDVETVALLAQRFLHPEQIRQLLGAIRDADGSPRSGPDESPARNEDAIRRRLYAADERQRLVVLNDFARQWMPVIAAAAPALPLDLVIPTQASLGYYAANRGGVVLVEWPVRFSVEADIPVDGTIEIDNRIIPMPPDALPRLRQQPGSTVTLAAFARLTDIGPSTWISGDLLGTPVYALEQVAGLRLYLTLKRVAAYADRGLSEFMAYLPIPGMVADGTDPAGPTPRALVAIRSTQMPLVRLDAPDLEDRTAYPPEDGGPGSELETPSTPAAPADGPATLAPGSAARPPLRRPGPPYDVAGLSLDMTAGEAAQILRHDQIEPRLSFTPYRIAPALGFNHARIFMSRDNRETVALVADPDRDDGRLLGIGRYVLAAEPYDRADLVRAMIAKYGEPRAVNGPFLVWGGLPGRGEARGACFVRLDRPSRGRWVDADGIAPDWQDLMPSRALQGAPGPRAMPWPSLRSADAQPDDIESCGPAVTAWVPLARGARDYAVWLTDVRAYPARISGAASSLAIPLRPRL